MKKKDTNEIKVDKINKKEENKAKENIKNDVNKNKIENLKNNKNINLPYNEFIIKIVNNSFSLIKKKLQKILLKKIIKKIRQYLFQLKIEREERISDLYELFNEKKFIYKMKYFYNLDKGLFNYEPNYLIDNFLIKNNNTNLELNIHDSTDKGGSILNSAENI